VDLAGDGDLDILSGSSNGGAQWAENTAEKEITVKGFKSLISEGSREPIWVNQKAGPAGSTRVWADDVNGDGKLDILMGDSTTINTSAKGLSMGKVFLAEKEWEEKMLIMRTEMQNPSEDSKDQSKLRNEYNKLYRSRSEFLTSERTDFVWLYLGK
jgi:hypothetical protein